MRLLIQRVTEARVTVKGKIISEIDQGLLVFVGFEAMDMQEDIDWGARKLVNLRIFEDEHSIPNLSLQETGGEILLVSQFTLHAATKKGNRPSYIRATNGEAALVLYQKLIKALENILQKQIFTGEFGVEMKVHLINDGPHTIWIDTKNKE